MPSAEGSIIFGRNNVEGQGDKQKSDTDIIKHITYFGKAKIGYLHISITVKQYICRLEVVVDDAGMASFLRCINVLQGAHNL